MNAKEAREKAMSIETGIIKIQYEEIMERIKEAVEKGSFSAYYFESIIPAVNIKLEEDGFTVTSSSDLRNEITYVISW